jgi:hypothetical protein
MRDKKSSHAKATFLFFFFIAVQENSLQRLFFGTHARNNLPTEQKAQRRKNMPCPRRLLNNL